MSTNGMQKIPVIGVPPEPAKPAKKGKRPKKQVPKPKNQPVAKPKAQRVKNQNQKPKPKPKPIPKPAKVQTDDGGIKFSSDSELNAYRLFMRDNLLGRPEFMTLPKKERKEKKEEARREFFRQRVELTKQWGMLPVKPYLEARKQRKARQLNEQKPPSLMDKIIEPVQEAPKPETAGQRGYQYLEENWLKNTWKLSSPEASTAPPINSYQPSTSQYSPKPVETNYSTFLSQIDSYQQQSHEQEPSAYHKMFHSSSPITPRPSQLPADMEAAVAMQQRLLEIDRELEEIERQKVEMAMADELRRREAELKEKERELERKEREFRRREEEMRRRRRSRSSSRERSYRREEWRDDRRSSHHHRQDHHRHSSSSSRLSAFQASSPYRAEIRIETRDRLREERDADAARRHGQRRPRLPSGQDAQRRQGSSGHSSNHYGIMQMNDISDDDNW